MEEGGIRMFARIGRLFRGFLGLFISGIEEANPEALMEAARTEFRQKMTRTTSPSRKWPASPNG